MNALVVFVLLHCGQIEAVIVDSPTEVHWAVIDASKRESAKKLVLDLAAEGAKVYELKLEGDKVCGVST